MSKYPNNKYWDHKFDAPVTLFTQSEWDEAEEGGFITAEHVFERSQRMLLHAMGVEGPAAYDEEGFFLALVADSTSEELGIKLVVHSNDHDPPHCHVKFQGRLVDDFRIDLITGDFLNDPPVEIRSKDLKKMKTVFVKHREILIEFWDKRNQEGATAINP